MGMYTELIFGARLKETTPVEVIDTLKWMLSNSETQEPLPHSMTHKLFEYDPMGGFKTRVRWMLKMGSYYFGVNCAVTDLRFDKICNSYVISTRSNLKNYDNDIELFLDWIKPYIESGTGTRNMYAIVCYEEQADPTIYYLEEKE